MWRLVLVLGVGCGRWGFSDVDAGGVADAGTTISFGERPGATHTGVTEDTVISSTSPTSNHGGDDSLSLSMSDTGLIRFDLSALPPSTTVVGATLHFATDNTPTIGTITLYPVLEAWTEGTSIGGMGVANYTMRTAAASWTDPGAGAPSSRSTTAVASFAPTAGGTDYATPLDAAGVAQVQAWVSSPATNFGLALVATGAGTGELVTHENVTASNRPLLVVTVR